MRISKVVVCGTKQSGKTSILEQVIYGNAGPFQPTKEDVYEVNVETDRGTIEHIRLYDTEGVDHRINVSGYTVQDQLPKHLLAVADGVVIVYSVDDERSFQVAEAIRKEVRNEKREGGGVSGGAKHAGDNGGFVVVVIGNKTDSLPRAVDSTQALNWAAREKVKLFEVSAKNRNTLFEPLVYLGSRLAPPVNKSTFSQLTIGRNKNTAKD